jgi:hypothetical protein
MSGRETLDANVDVPPIIEITKETAKIPIIVLTRCFSKSNFETNKLYFIDEYQFFEMILVIKDLQLVFKFVFKFQ